MKYRLTSSTLHPLSAQIDPNFVVICIQQVVFYLWDNKYNVDQLNSASVTCQKNHPNLVLVLLSTSKHLQTQTTHMGMQFKFIVDSVEFFHEAIRSISTNEFFFWWLIATFQWAKGASDSIVQCFLENKGSK